MDVREYVAAKLFIERGAAFLGIAEDRRDAAKYAWADAGVFADAEPEHLHELERENLRIKNRMQKLEIECEALRVDMQLLHDLLKKSAGL